MKKVSIIVPLYKSEKFLPKLMDSIITQTYSNLEIILVDDGSPDRSGEIADEYAKKDKRVYVIHKQNGGCCDARNAGLDKATGYYLMFADGDDWLEPDCVEYLVRIAEENGCEMSTTDAIYTTRDREQNEYDNIRVWNKEQAICGIIKTFIIPVGPWNKLYTMDVVRKNNITFSVPWFGEGLYFSAMNAQFSNKMAVGHRKVYNYRLNNPNSGCTLKEVKNGVNALENIKYIRKVMEIDSRKIKHAFEWHIWCNNALLISYIVGSNTLSQNSEMLKRSKAEMWKLLPSVMLFSGTSIKYRIGALANTAFPIMMARRGLKKASVQLANDKMD